MKERYSQILLGWLLAVTLFTSCEEDYHFVDRFSDESGVMVLEGKEGSDEEANMVYVSLNQAAQIKVSRKSWDLGFYCGDRYRVVLNSSHKVVAVPTAQSDFAAVTLADAEKAIDLNDTGMASPTSVVVEASDNFDGDLDKTVFAEISADENENKVYFVVNEETSLEGEHPRSNWYKVKVNRNARGGYSVEYGKVTDRIPVRVELDKRPGKTFVGFSLDSGQQVDLPGTGSWDLMWATAAADVQMKQNGPIFHTHSRDVITINRHDGVQVSTIMLVNEQGEKTGWTYEDYTLDDARTTVWQDRADVIGTTWRKSGGPQVSGGVRDDRFYVFRTATGECFKLRFLRYGAGDGGVRGKPELEFQKLEEAVPESE